MRLDVSIFKRRMMTNMCESENSQTISRMTLIAVRLAPSASDRFRTDSAATIPHGKLLSQGGKA